MRTIKSLTRKSEGIHAGKRCITMTVLSLLVPSSPHSSLTSGSISLFCLASISSGATGLRAESRRVGDFARRLSFHGRPAASPLGPGRPSGVFRVCSVAKILGPAQQARLASCGTTSTSLSTC